MNGKIVLTLLLLLSLSTITKTELTTSVTLKGLADARERHNVSSGTINVPKDFASIQEAIDAASDGDMISVAAGEYYEHVSLDKSVALLGEEGAIINGNGTGNIISITRDNVEISGFKIQNGYKGILLSHSVGSIIRSNTLMSHTWAAIELQNSNETIISGNRVSDSDHAIYLIYSSCGNTISYNVLTNNSQGLPLSWHCNANTILGNTVKSNSFAGIVLGGNNNNTIYHNNFINNIDQVYSYNSSNTWDNGAEGNYWSDYLGIDQDGDGMGDTNLPHKGLDHNPLVEPWSTMRMFDIFWGGETYRVTTICNSTVASFRFSHTLKQVSFNVTGPSGMMGFCNVTFPNTLLWGDLLVRVDGASPRDLVRKDNDTHTSVSFGFEFLSTLEVMITSEYVVPEFSACISMLFTLAVSTVALVLYRRLIRTKTETSNSREQSILLQFQGHARKTEELKGLSLLIKWKKKRFLYSETASDAPASRLSFLIWCLS